MSAFRRLRASSSLDWLLLAWLPIALLVLIVGAFSPRPQAAQGVPPVLSSFMYTQALEETRLPPNRFLSVSLQHTPNAPNGVNLFPVLVWLNGALLPAQPTSVWILNETSVAIVLPSIPPVDPIAISGQAPSVRINVEYWWGE